MVGWSSPLLSAPYQSIAYICSVKTGETCGLAACSKENKKMDHAKTRRPNGKTGGTKLLGSLRENIHTRAKEWDLTEALPTVSQWN